MLGWPMNLEIILDGQSHFKLKNRRTSQPWQADPGAYQQPDGHFVQINRLGQANMEIFNYTNH
jgi:hypothetical protein